MLHFIAGKRLAARRLTVVDATNVQAEARKPLVNWRASSTACRLPSSSTSRQGVPRAQPERARPQLRRARGAPAALAAAPKPARTQREGFRYIHVLDASRGGDAATIERTKLWTNRRDEHGPFDIIGDVHGCLDELVSLLEKLGYEVGGLRRRGRRCGIRRAAAVFLGDLVDRGPDVPRVLRLVMAMVDDGTALCVPGNHESS